MVSQSTKTETPPTAGRESLLEAATAVFQAEGFAGARVDEIARRAGANKAMIYYHFRSKQGLYKAVLAALFGPLLEEVARLQANEPDPRRRLAGLYTRMARRFEEQPALPHIMLREVLSGGEGMDDESVDAFGVMLRFVVTGIADGVAAGAFRPVDPIVTHLSVVSPLLLFFVSRGFRNRIVPAGAPHLREPSPAEVLANQLDVLFRHLSPDAPAQEHP